MALPIPEIPRVEPIVDLVTAQAVSAAQVARIVSDLGFLLGRQVQPIVSTNLVGTATTPVTIPVAYARSPGVSLVRVDIELAVGAAADARVEIGITAPGYTLSPLPTTPFDGTTPITLPSDVRVDYPIYSTFVDVTALPVGAIVDLLFTITNVNKGVGVYRLQVTEVPIAQSDPAGTPATEIGVDPSWTAVGGAGIYDGTTGGPTGYARVVGQLDKARGQCRRHWQLVTYEAAALAFSASTAVLGALSFGSGNPYNPTLLFRARRLYDTATPNAYTFRARMAASIAGASVQLQILVGGVAVGTISATPADTAFHAYATAVSIPTNTAAQELQLTFLGSSFSGTVYVSQLALIEAEA